MIAEERPRLSLTQSFSKLFKDLGLSPRAVSTAFGSRVNLAICLQVRFIHTESSFDLVLHSSSQFCAPDLCSNLSNSYCFSFFLSQGTAGPDPSTVYVDMKSLRHDRYAEKSCTIKMSHDQGSVKRILLFLRVRLVERGAPQSLPLMESGTVSIDC